MLPSGDVGDLWEKYGKQKADCKNSGKFSNNQCEVWKKQGHCQHPWLKANCKKTCNHCAGGGIADIHLGK